jgi:hypothetical protein
MTEDESSSGAVFTGFVNMIENLAENLCRDTVEGCEAVLNTPDEAKHVRDGRSQF